ncbi:hypothetical protein AGABI2DRAFT_144107 [Agaricus bisporus var. bisporus H97]|uniref:hypothetical protein n=1 Tax=Agaricus bisporus var. bisporus (strain H97 / ATCC MYA-4626 / FGSC 10389) TaxID=936046 RepID=UPI00029F72F8|nr:hypothetical protein AGABI2DRAFT_144107 [Agaricus bisporus var. bisporus H97]EKV45728.1 hypothetical protein AGABI2DRAFT_144107 [Agaricus bisporus var. bisporus H97]
MGVKCMKRDWVEDGSREINFGGRRWNSKYFDPVKKAPGTKNIQGGIPTSALEFMRSGIRITGARRDVGGMDGKRIENAKGREKRRDVDRRFGKTRGTGRSEIVRRS